MRVLVVGNGAREHAIVWKMAQSPMAPEIVAAPGNAGTAQIAENAPIRAEDTDSLLQYADSADVDLTVVGPEGPLAAGIVDRFEDAGRLIFGPSRKASQIESSKSFAKGIMASAGVPTAASQSFCDISDALGYIRCEDPPFVVKADGLAAGKGVVMAADRADAADAVTSMMRDEVFGDSGKTVLIEEWLTGKELSVFAFVDGEHVSPMVAACDYKRVGDGDTGPNTGGMGSYSPPSFWDQALDDEIRMRIMEPVVNELTRQGAPYRGVLFAGLMLTENGVKVIEFNCRLGDPEAQVIVPRLASDLLEIVHKTALGQLDQTEVEWNDVACVGVVSASDGYPETYDTGHEISGLSSVDPAALVFHAGTQLNATNKTLTSGGRVLTVTGKGQTVAEARTLAYQNTARIDFDGRFHRNDIASHI